MFLFFPLFLLANSLLFAQQAGPAKDLDYSLKVPVELVLVPVTVEDSDGNPALGLQKDDFRLLEEGTPQAISFFSVDPVPMSVAILIDRSTDARTQSVLEQTLVPLTEAFSPFDELAVYQFENTVEQVQGFTLDKGEVLKGFKKISLRGYSPAISGGPFSNEPSINGIPLDTGAGKVPPPKTINTHINDALFGTALDLRIRNRDRRKVILVISNGQNAPGNRHSYDDTLEALLQTEISVYGIGQGTAMYFRKNTLTRFANATGGSVWYPTGISGFSETFQRLGQLARNQYVLGYLPSSKVETLTFRKFEVVVNRKGLKVGKIRHRQGYYAVPHQ
jgi:VWFA-related protein